MNITLELQHLDDLIIEHTRPPVTGILRNKLHPLRDQMEAYIAEKEQVADLLKKTQTEYAAFQLAHPKESPDLGKTELSILKLAHDIYPERYTGDEIGKKLNLVPVDLCYSLRVLLNGDFMTPPAIGQLWHDGQPNPRGYAITTKGIEAVRRNKV